MSASKFRPLLSLKFKNPVNKIPQCTVSLKEAVHITRSLCVGYPDKEIAINIQCRIDDPAVKNLRGIVVLPHSFLNTKTLVFATGNSALIAKDCGADIVGGEELIEKVVNDELEFDRVICTPEMLKSIAKPLARILGPRGIMPTEKKGTVTDDIASAMKAQADAIIFKADANSFISSVIGKVKMSQETICENVDVFVDHLKSLNKKSSLIQEMYITAKDKPQILFNHLKHDNDDKIAADASSSTSFSL